MAKIHILQGWSDGGQVYFVMRSMICQGGRLRFLVLYPLSIIIQCFSSMNIAQYKLVLHSGAKLRGFRNTMKSTCVISCVRGAQAFLVMRGAQTGLHNRMDVKLITIKDSRPSYDDTCNLDGNFYHVTLIESGY